MKLVIGSGNKRVVYDLPCAELIKRASDEVVKDGVAAVVDIMRGRGVKFA